MTPEQDLKLRFADAWLRSPGNAYAAALTLTKNNVQLALQLVDAFIFDDEVSAFKTQLVEEYGEAHFLPSKFQMVREVYDRAKNNPIDDSYIRLMKLAADMMGFIEKPGVVINNNSQTNNRVMFVPMARLNENGTVDADLWEKDAISQQQALTQ